MLLTVNHLHKFITNYSGKNPPNVHIIDASIQGIIILVKIFHGTRDGAKVREQVKAILPKGHYFIRQK